MERKRAWRGVGIAAVAVAAAGVLVVVWIGVRRLLVAPGRGGPVGALVEMAEDTQEAAQRAVEQRADDEGEVSPFEGVEWTAERMPRVMVGGAWYELVSLDGWAVGEMLAFIDERFGEAAREERFELDLGLTLEESGRRVGVGAVLRLRPVGGGAEVEVEAAMTEENRSALWKRRSHAGGGGG